MPGKAVLLDYDGVLANSFDVQFEWFHYISGLLGKDFPFEKTEEGKRKVKEEFYEEPFARMYQKIGISEEPPEWTTVRKEYSDFKKNHKDRIKPFEGVEEALEILKAAGYSLAVASSNSEDQIREFLSDNGLLGYFDAIVGYESLPVGPEGKRKVKPDPAVLLATIEKLGSPGEIHYIGDQSYDYEAAQRAGAKLGIPINPLLVSSGYATEKRLLNDRVPKEAIFGNVLSAAREIARNKSR